MKLPHGLTTGTIRVLQEFKRAKVEELTADAIVGIEHPAATEVDLAQVLVGKGFISTTEGGFALTERGKAFLESNPAPGD